MTALAHCHGGGFLQAGNAGPAVGVMALMALPTGCRISRRLGLPTREEDLEVIVEVLPGCHIGMAPQAMLVAEW